MIAGTDPTKIEMIMEYCALIAEWVPNSESNLVYFCSTIISLMNILIIYSYSPMEICERCTQTMFAS